MAGLCAAYPQRSQRFVDDVAGGDFDTWAGSFTNVAPLVDTLATTIHRQGITPRADTRKKMWMLMRWLVRPAPDLHRWKKLSPAELMVPVDSNVTKLAIRARIIPPLTEKEAPAWRHVVAITDYARALYPTDPAKIDYSFFIWGRGARSDYRGPDTCHRVLRRAGTPCPLNGTVLSCGERCPGNAVG